MRIFILTGEPSGDLHGAHLARALRELNPDLTVVGVGGTRMREAGVQLIAESEHWGAIGIPEAARKAPGLFLQLLRLERLLRADPPDVLVPIDFGAFNVTLLKRLHGAVRTVYFIPPGCWSRMRPAGVLPSLVEGIATPFPWSAENLKKAGAPARIEWVGHPLMDYIQAVPGTREEARRQLGLDPARTVIAVVPGSRRSELRYLLPPFLDTLRRLTPAPQALLTVAPSLGEARVRALLPPDLDIRLLRGIDYAAIRAADAALAASGTATLELACLDIPQVVAYRGSFGTWVQYRIVARGGRLRHISLPNIICDRAVVPELLQQHANPRELAAALSPLLADSPERQAQLAAFAEIRAALGDGHAVERTSRMILEIAAQVKTVTA